ncbi:hypothetical protein AB6C80_023460 [Vibrio cyclitrophicus]
MATNSGLGLSLPKGQARILAKYVTYRTVATEIIFAAMDEDPKLWENVDFEKPPTWGSASKVLRDYMTGDSIPSERVSDERILFIEKFFLFLPKTLCFQKSKKGFDHNHLGKKPSERSVSHQKKEETIFIKS